MRGMRYVLSFALLALAVACSKSSSPTAPSSTVQSTAPGARTGATISGSLLFPGSVSGVHVAVVGTDLSAAADGSGRFALNGVPAGDANLSFAGPGMDARLTVTGVQSTETITLGVNLSGSSATLDTETRVGGTQSEAEGRIAALSGSTFDVAGETVMTDGHTRFVQHGVSRSLSDLSDGDRVTATGTMSGATLMASTVEIEDAPEPPDAPEAPEPEPQTEAEVTGTIVSRTGTAPVLTLVVGTTTVITSASTEISAGESEDGEQGSTQGFAALQVGATVGVEGVKQANGSINATEIKVTSASQNANVDVEGSVSGLTTGCPAVQFVVGGLTIVTDASTTFEETSCASLANGMRVEVTGVKQVSGTVKAVRVEKKD